jgi:ribonuclease HI
MGEIEEWKKLWKLNIPSKIKIFGWRALHGMIPCKGVLANRHVGNSSSCPVCTEGCEDIKHILFTCSRMKLIWKALGIEDKIQRLLNLDRSGSVILQEVIRMGGSIDGLKGVRFAELILTAGWYFWWERRQLVHGEKIQTPARSAISIAALTMNYCNVKKASVVKDGWKKPPEGYLKLNVDAGYDETTSTGSTGAVIRDSSGGFIAASQRYLDNVIDAPTCEVIALRDGLLLAQQLGVSKLIAQSDCMEVVEAMQNGGFSATVGAPFFDECWLLCTEFNSISVEFCYREANFVAHNLARNSLVCKLSCNWHSEPPGFIMEPLVNDVSVIAMK